MTIKHITKLSLSDNRVMLIEDSCLLPSRLAKLNSDKSTDGEVPGNGNSDTSLARSTKQHNHLEGNCSAVSKTEYPCFQGNTKHVYKEVHGNPA